MTLFDIDQFNQLAQKQANLCVSIYTPTDRQSTDGYQANKINFKNALTEARTQLTDQYGLSAAAAETFLAEGVQLLDDQEFWMRSSDMLAYFIVDGEGTAIKLPLPIESQGCWVGSRPYLLPLIPELNDDGHFYLLALNLKEVSLFEINRSAIQLIELPDDMSTSYTEEIEDADNQKALQHRSGIGEAGAMFHGQGSGSDENRKVAILQYYHRLSADIDALLNRNPLPLLLAGVDYLIPIYKQVSKYAHIVEPHLIGSYSADDMLALAAEAWDLMEPHFSQNRLARKEEYGLFTSRGQSDSDTETVILTALSGGIDTLFVQSGQDVWGTYDSDAFTLQIDETTTPQNYSLINEAAKKTKEYGGRVYLVDSESMPAAGSVVAGIFRYPLTEVSQENESAAN
ncbi:hypothetical protein M0L20_23285 [Spirosoma sp. RP8]|uniref:Uncharacterized protein n=1 Tax=Spirosoma liriopis TaxID=2937440 RepID=A0ABT0HSK1_9BACT|nr:hypothetical protein [Spirosoma liriopis]MCK8494812.1 hypothetical protein [Spirosoma liriopis]